MANLIRLTNTMEDVGRFWNGRLIDLNMGESTLKGSILLNGLAVFTERNVSSKEPQITTTHANVAPMHRNFSRVEIDLERLGRSSSAQGVGLRHDQVC